MLEELIEELGSFSSNPLGFVMWAFPWGEAGTVLEFEDGPEAWQVDVLDKIGRGIVTLNQAVRIARCSGHGVGKSALVSWIILWALTTYEDCKGVVTANTENQLKTKTWAELAKWYELFIAKDAFEFTATRLSIKTKDAEKQAKWKIDMVPWSERNTEAFAGLHNKGKRILMVMDEASAIPELIWEVVEGATTDKDTEIVWVAFGNPTQSLGRFRDCFPGGKFEHRWDAAAIDSREVRFTNKDEINNWLEDYGEDHDFFRIRVRGVFPRVNAESFISFEVAREAATRELEYGSGPIILGVDVGRFGDDPSVIYPRRGRDARTHFPEVYFYLDTMSFAEKVAKAFRAYNASIVFIDDGGVGGGVVDRLRQLKIPLMAVDFGNKPDNYDANDGTKYANKRAEMWGRLREWLKYGCMIEKIPGVERTIPEELAGPRFGMNGKEAILLENKKDMRKRGVKSTNVGDALALTFAYDIPEFARDAQQEAPVVTPDYNPFSEERLQWAH